VIVVIPTNRRLDLGYLSPLIDVGARFIVVDDSEGSVEVNHPQFSVFNWNDRRKMLGKLDAGFAKRNGACRDFGFYVAWRESDPGEAIVALDDDCKVYHDDFARMVESALSDDPRPVARCEGRHLNILDLYDGAPPQLFPRGFPYSSRPGYEPAVIGETESRPVTFSLGMWKGIFDINGIDKIKGPEYLHPDIELAERSVIVERSKLISVCSMNMQFRRELIPAAYQAPMHVEVMPGWVIDRYGDIWGGFILKTLMDLKGEAMAVGEPMIRHLKEGDYMRNVWQEHICHLVNDEFLEVLGEAAEEITPASYLEMMSALGEEFGRRSEKCSSLLKPYLRHLSEAMAARGKALSLCGPASVTPPESVSSPA